ncbi:MAG: SMP-30/gluconolactonase/LRE family protein [Terriglobia bacterium]
MSIVRIDPAFDELLPQGSHIEKLADGFLFTEGPLWKPDEGVLWFSDVIGNVTRQWSPDGVVKELLRPGGYDGNSLPQGGFTGPNGCTAGPDGATMLCQHGNRRIVRIDRDMKVTTLIDSYNGSKLNSPNDLVYRSDGTLYFTDPPYGLPLFDEDPTKELPFNGVFKFANGKLDLVVEDMTRPNGLAFSPDEKTLYVANSDDSNRILMRFDVHADGSVSNGSVFADVTDSPEGGLPDGLKIDVSGNVWTTGPGGIWVFTPEGKHLGTIKPPQQPANIAWGNDGSMLYITAITGLYRIQTSVMGQKLVYSHFSGGRA